MAENQAKLEQFLQRTENKLKYGVSSYKCASTKSHLKSPPPPPEKAELKRASKRPTVVDFGVTKPLRDPKIELERQRHKENLKKYSPANLRAQAREKRNVEQAEVCFMVFSKFIEQSFIKNSLRIFVWDAGMHFVIFEFLRGFFGSNF